MANTEKTIFLGPANLQIPTVHPTLKDLKLESLSPSRTSIRTNITAKFPTSDHKYGASTWVLLHTLNEGQRYEVRVCWAATQPTSIRMETYELQTVFETPDLILSLAQYRVTLDGPAPLTSSTFDSESSVLLLHIQAAADYFTMDKSLMKDVLPVYIDVILDPFVLNVLPKSLIPTALYIVMLAIGSWFLAGHIYIWIRQFAADETKEKKS
ncbi:hypothetical protein BJ878DRAFT_426700 [Calycina marina]|uniref:Uncharacterized protein n=1 Tax=Calycina marina TaxID=1763456 RepID=A0A9P7YYI9_9HELO|nr:hypothetical protein BJ878DRAFT_426700 [Calycina marina]